MVRLVTLPHEVEAGEASTLNPLFQVQKNAQHAAVSGIHGIIPFPFYVTF